MVRTETGFEVSAAEFIPLPQDDPRLTEALYGVSEAATYLHIPARTLHDWVGGAGRTDRNRLVHAFPSKGGSMSVPFMGLAEAYVLSSFRLAGISVRQLRPSLERLKQYVGLDYALASGHLYSDGRQLLFDLVKESDPGAVATLTELRSGQTVFKDVIWEYLKVIRWDAKNWPEALPLPAFRRAQVIVDFRQAFGRPILVHGGARVEDLVDRWQGGDDIATIARDFGVPQDECEDAIRVASSLRQAA